MSSRENQIDFAIKNFMNLCMCCWCRWWWLKEHRISLLRKFSDGAYESQLNFILKSHISDRYKFIYAHIRAVEKQKTSSPIVTDWRWNWSFVCGGGKSVESLNGILHSILFHVVMNHSCNYNWCSTLWIADHVKIVLH